MELLENSASFQMGSGKAGGVSSSLVELLLVPSAVVRVGGVHCLLNSSFHCSRINVVIESPILLVKTLLRRELSGVIHSGLVS